MVTDGKPSLLVWVTVFAAKRKQAFWRFYFCWARLRPYKLYPGFSGTFLVIKNKNKILSIVCLQNRPIFLENVKRQPPNPSSDHEKTIHGTLGHVGARWVDVRPRIPLVSFGVRAPLAMTLGALERGDAQLSSGSNQVQKFWSMLEKFDFEIWLEIFSVENFEKSKNRKNKDFNWKFSKIEK